MWWLVIAAVSPGTVSPAGAALMPPVRDATARPKLNLRLVERQEFEPQPVRRSGMIVESPIAPNAAIGLGLFRVSARRPLGMEPKVEPQRPSAKKVGLSVRLQF